jgi:hypothetical protein
MEGASMAGRRPASAPPPGTYRWQRLACAAAGFIACPATAFAHAADRGFILLLPTDRYLFGGALAVLISIGVLAILPPRPLSSLFDRRLNLLPLPRIGRTLASLASLLFLAALVAAGFLGSADPLSNPLPLVIWTVFWVGLTLLTGLVGNLWLWLNPWYGVWRLALRLGWKPPLCLPSFLDAWPAVIGLFAFGWFELVDPAPDNPPRLAVAILLYWTLTLAGILAFGYRQWTRRAEFLSVFFAMLARLALLGRSGSRLALRLPGAGAVAAAPLSTAATCFLLLALATVSFDGLMRTFFWLAATGINPLEFPGRSQVMGASTLGLALMFVLLAAAYYLSVWLGSRMAGSGPGLKQAAGRLVWSILPIALAYHFSHYLVSFVINVQYALAALSDPLSNGANLFGTAGMHVQAGATMGMERAWLIWNAQSAAIIGGHMLAVLLAHVIAWRMHGDARRATPSQIPLGILMIGYTIFGLWLLSSPTGG